MSDFHASGPSSSAVLFLTGLMFYFVGNCQSERETDPTDITEWVGGRFLCKVKVKCGRVRQVQGHRVSAVLCLV